MELLTISEAARLVGVCVGTLREWDRSGVLRPSSRTPGGHRRYSLDDLRAFLLVPSTEATRQVVLYSRVSSRKQVDDLERQASELRDYAAANNISSYKEISDVGSGINFRKRGFVALLRLVFAGNVGTVVVAHRDRLSRFGFDLMESVCREFGTEIRVVGAGEKPLSDAEAMASDILSLVTVFSCRTNGRRAAANRRKLKESLSA
jgi:putative resolvase